jgi:hypothetical protein
LTEPARSSQHRPHFDTDLSIRGHAGFIYPFDEKAIVLTAHGIESAFRVERQLMRTRISDRTIATIHVIRWAGIMIVMGMFLTVIGASISECLANPR